MDSLGQLAVLTGAVFGSWVIVELRGASARFKGVDTGKTVALVLVLLGLLIGWVVQLTTGGYVILGMVALAVAIAIIAELGRMF